ncbi:MULTISPECIES: hypothetical protein [Xanthomonas]|uniref:hypothetical protein n=1 Tax=Xanthomonas TaxID=338 RepID=UPI000E1F7083|nr:MULTISPECIES: hypothetical protein [Xanthomonas]
MTPSLWISVVLMTVIAAAPAAAASQAAVTPNPDSQAAPCVEVQIGQTSTGRLSCLNQLLRETTARATGARQAAVTPATGSPIHLGQPTPAALRQRLGQAYGRSAQPQRPAPPRYPTLFAPVR